MIRSLESRKKQSDTCKKNYADGLREKRPPKHNKPHSEETKLLLSKKAKERYKSGWIDKRIGIPRSEETKRKISDSKIGISIKHSGQFKNGHIPPNKGNPISEDDKLRISEAVLNSPNKYCGPKHWNWKGGVNNLHRLENNKERQGIKWKIWRKNVFERDDYTCQICGIRGVVLHPHHIKSFRNYIELRYSVDNGITLCNKCHANSHKGKDKCIQALHIHSQMVQKLMEQK